MASLSAEEEKALLASGLRTENIVQEGGDLSKDAQGCGPKANKGVVMKRKSFLFSKEIYHLLDKTKIRGFNINSVVSEESDQRNYTGGTVSEQGG